MHAAVKSRPHSRRHQSGYALLMFAVLLALGLIFAVVNEFDGITLRQTRDQRTALALARAKEALIAWSVSRGDIGPNATKPPRPGELPCPDTNGDGVQEGTCSAGSIGRLPWRTLGIDALRDGYGETLWYAIDGNFRTAQMTTVINSDSRAKLTIYAADGTTLLTPPGYEAAAVIFSAGPPLTGQARGTTTEQNTIANYLESNGIVPLRSNVTPGGPFIQGPVADTSGNTVVNDTLLAVSAAEVIHAAEVRVGATVKLWLNNFNATYHYLPYPARYNAAGCTDVSPIGTAINTDCMSDSTQCRGRFPECAEAIAANCATSLNKGWPSGTLPPWFTANLWAQTIYYSAGDNHLAAPTGACAGNLSVDGQPVRGVIAFAGSPYGTTIRNSPTQSLQLADYLVYPANQDGWGATPDDSYTKPASSSRNWFILLN